MKSSKRVWEVEMRGREGKILQAAKTMREAGH